jgi:hypothetical protein
MSEIDPRLLLRAAARARSEPALLGATLTVYQARRGLDDVALATELGCDEVQLARLMLCRPPRDDHFAADLAQIAGRIGLGALPLARVLRLAAALDVLADTASGVEGLRAARRAEGGDDSADAGRSSEEPE